MQRSETHPSACIKTRRQHSEVECATQIFNYAPVAQLDRVLVSEAKGHRFDSCRAHHNLERAYLVKGSEPFLFQAENINLGISKRKLVNRWNLQIPASQS